MKPIYLYVSYVTTPGSGSFTYGSIYLKLNKPTCAGEIVDYIHKALETDHPDSKFEKPVILSITILKRKIYEMLTGK